jgi:hypothetical protein
MIISIFLDRISRNNKYGVFAFRITAFALIIIGLISNLHMISRQNYMISTIRKGYNYVSFGKQLRYVYGADIERPLDFIRRIDKKDRRFFYDGYRWAIPEGKGDLSVKDYVQKNIAGGVDKDCWPFAYENMGKVIEENNGYSRSADEELKSAADKSFYPYFYLGLGKGLVKKGLDETEYNYILGIIDKQYWRYLHEGIGTEIDTMFIENQKKLIQFMPAADPEARKDIYRGFANGREYAIISYRDFQTWFGKISRGSMEEWESRVGNIEEEFRPYCYQRLGVEVGWRFSYGIKKYRDFMKEADAKYAAHMYKGLGMGIGWRFGDDISGCALLIKQAEQRYWPYIYEGLGMGVAKRYGYQIDGRLQDVETEKIPAEYRYQFRKGLKEGYGT